MQFNVPKFKIRASSAARIMSGGRGKSKDDKIADIEAKLLSDEARYTALKEGLVSKTTLGVKIKADKEALEILKNTPEELPEGVKTYCENWLKSKLYEKEKTFYAKQADKGDKTEESSIDYLDYYYGWTNSGKEFEVKKNDIWRQNDFCQGTSDLVLANKIIDTKNSYDCFSFPLFERELPNQDYWWQGQIYMELWGRVDFEVIYVLSDLPEEDIRKEAKYKLPVDATNLDYEIFRQQYIYSHLDDFYRIRRFPFKKDEAAIKALRDRVEACQKYIDSLLGELSERAEKEQLEFCTFQMPNRIAA